MTFLQLFPSKAKFLVASAPTCQGTCLQASSVVCSASVHLLRVSSCASKYFFPRKLLILNRCMNLPEHSDVIVLYNGTGSHYELLRSLG